MSTAPTGPPPPPCPHCGQSHGEEILKCPDTDMPLPLAGRLLDKKFRLVFKIGSGGMASVWLAKNTYVGRNVAIKLLRPEVMKVPELIVRFRDEARAAARIGSKHICEVIDFGTSSLGPFIVMEQLVGEDLSAVIDRHKQLDYGWAVRIVREALKGLEAAHDKGIVHRDLKPGNIFLHEADGELVVKLMDFGVSKFMDGSSEAETANGVLLGTPEYMAPEQLKGAGNIDHRADVFAIGAILYRAITGQQVFSGPNLAAKLMSMAHDTPPPIEDQVDGVPPDLVTIINRCLEREPIDRFQTARSLRAALSPFDDKSEEEFSLSSIIGSALEVESLGEGLAAATPQPGLDVAVDADEGGAEASDLPTRVESTGDLPLPSPSPAVATPPSPAQSGLSPAGLWAVLGVAVALIVAAVWWSGSNADDDEHETNSPGELAEADDYGELPPPPPALDLPPDEVPPDILAAEAGGETDGDETGGDETDGDETDGDETDGDETGGDETDGDETGAADVGEQGEGLDPSNVHGVDPKRTPPRNDPPDPESFGPAPAGTLRSGPLVTPQQPGAATDHRTAFRYCEGLAEDRFAGIGSWSLANPTQAKSFVGTKGIRRTKYWTTAKWRGKVSVFSLPNGKKHSISSEKKSARPLCVAERD